MKTVYESAVQGDPFDGGSKSAFRTDVVVRSEQADGDEATQFVFGAERCPASQRFDEGGVVQVALPAEGDDDGVEAALGECFEEGFGCVGMEFDSAKGLCGSFETSG